MRIHFMFTRVTTILASILAEGICVAYNRVCEFYNTLNNYKHELRRYNSVSQG